ncbi:hypothetical protein INR49_013094 [Caranx melampygus]|nr:hypothetical protein INR49_013094 [Caranx melampygus]
MVFVVKVRSVVWAGKMLLPAVKVRVLQELLTGQPLRRVHPQTTLQETGDRAGQGGREGGYSWSMSDFPGHRGMPDISSANTQPIAHTSTGGPY